MEIVDKRCAETTSGTTLTATVNAKEGDIILATITVRSALSISDGWKLIYTSDYLSSSGDLQSISFATRTAKNSTESITVTQANSNRTYINLISIRGIKRVEYYPELETYVKTNPGVYGYKIPVPDKKENEKVIWGCSATTWSASTPCGSWLTNPNDLEMISLDQARTAPRQANFFDTGKGAINRTFTATPNTAGSVCVIAAVKLIETEYKYLVMDEDGDYYTVAEGALQALNIAEPTGQSFLDHGVDQVPEGKLLLPLKQPKVLYWQESNDPLPVLTATVSAVPAAQLLYTQDVDMTDSSIVGILNGGADASDGALFAFSFDAGLTYLKFDGADWVEAGEADGMTKVQIKAVTEAQWAQVAVTGRYRIRIMIAEGDFMKSIVINYKNEVGV